MSENIQVPQGWEVKKLGEVFKKVTEKNIHLKINTVLTNSAQFGVIPQNEFFDKSIATKENIDNYYILEMDNFIYNPRISKLAPAGPISRNKYGIGCVSPLYTVFKIHSNNNINFYEFYFKSNLWNRQAYNIANFGARFDRMNITDKDFFNMPIPVPPLEEQKKIADILSLWDKAIEQTKELIAYKEKQKKGLMQALLTGKKRLNGFTDEWKTYSFNELCKTYAIDRNLQINSNSYLSNGIIPIVDQGNKNIAGYTNDKKYIINSKNDGYIIFGDHTRIIKFIDFDFAIGADGTKILYSSSLILNKLLFYYLKNSKITNLGYSRHFKLLKELIFIIPTSLDEQKAIADILSSADEEIELLNKQLELYTEQKKGLMQNLLTGKVRV